MLHTLFRKSPSAKKTRINRNRSERTCQQRRAATRRLLTESLEDRKLLAVFTPGDVAELVADINTANSNGEDDTIDLGGLTFTLDDSNAAIDPTDGNTGLPGIEADGGNSLTIANGTIARDADAQRFRLLRVAGGANLTIDSVTLTGGRTEDGFGRRDGGAALVSSGGSLKVENSTISQNEGHFGGGIHARGALTISNSSIRENTGETGGGLSLIGNSSVATVRNSLISGNTAVAGGGGIRAAYGVQINLYRSVIASNSASLGGGILASQSNLKLLKTEVTGNNASLYGGGMNLGGGSVQIIDSLFSGNRASLIGGGFYTGGTDFELNNSTVSGNHAGKGGGGFITRYFSSTSLTVAQSTVTGNTADNSGAGIAGWSYGVSIPFRPADVTLNNSIVAGNTLTSGAASDLEEATTFIGIIASGMNNLIGDAATSGGLVDGTDGNIVGNNGTGTIDINTILDTNLADNGGPTQTHMLVDESPAIDAGSDALAVDADGNPLTTDQRGEARFVGTVDIGAVEVDLQPDPGVNVEDGVLTITGTEENDRILVKELWHHYYVFTNIEGFEYSKIPAADIDRIEVDGREGDDWVKMGLFVTVPTLIRGGEGDDWLSGGLGSDIILGGSGHDQIRGGWGNDLLIGGTGSDKVKGGFGKDLVVGGSTSVDEDDDALDSVLAAWNAGDPAGDLFDVIDDDEEDRLYGGWGHDRIFAGVGDRQYW